MSKFNLIDEPWIPCISNGTERKLSLQDVLLDMQNIQEVYHQSPVVVISLIRFLHALIYRIFSGPKNLQDWKVLYEKKSLDSTKVKAYLKKWHARFDLFDKDKPFYQSPSADTLKKTTNVSKLDLARASGHNSLLFDHTCDQEEVQLSPAEVVPYLIATQAHAIGGGNSANGVRFYSAPLTGKILYLISGNNLFETLLLNLVPLSSIQIPQNNNDAPAWEIDPPTTGEAIIVNGVLDYLTLQSRIVLLIPKQTPEGNTIVSRCYFAQGRFTERKVPIFDPATRYMENKKGELFALQFETDRALWRNSKALFESVVVKKGTSKERPPEVLNFVSRLAREGVVPKTTRYRLFVYGASSDQGKVYFWRHERMPLPVSYISDEAVFNKIREALDYAEEKGQDFSKACGIFCRWLLYSHKNDKDLSKADWAHIYKKGEAIASSRTYWSSLENPFFKLLDDLLINSDEALATWKKTVYRFFAKELGKVFQLPANDRQAYKAIGVTRNKAKVSILGDSGMNEEKAVAERLVYYLESLVKRNDLGALADLRRGAGKLPGEVPVVIRHTAQFLPEGKEAFFRAPVHLTATLFATHPKNTPVGNFGDHCVSLAKASGRKTSTDRQFLRLLTVSSDTLDIELRQFLGLLASQKVSVNYKDLFNSIYNWDHPDKFIQQGWAESFYKEIDPNNKD